jgi:hypothetical protein
MNPEGDFLWAIAEVAAEPGDLYIVWHFPTGSDETRDIMMGYNSQLVIQAFYDLFTEKEWLSCRATDRNTIIRVKRHEIPQTQFLHDSGAYVALALAHRILKQGESFSFNQDKTEWQLKQLRIGMEIGTDVVGFFRTGRDRLPHRVGPDPTLRDAAGVPTESTFKVGTNTDTRPLFHAPSEQQGPQDPK